jgi:hypothetical protein
MIFCLAMPLPVLYSQGWEGIPMQTIYIKFLTEDDRVRGFFELAKRARVGSLPDQVYQVPLEGLKLLEELHIAYRRATDAEVQSAHDQVRNPSPAVL